jgi:hypothetical protein
MRHGKWAQTACVAVETLLRAEINRVFTMLSNSEIKRKQAGQSAFEAARTLFLRAFFRDAFRRFSSIAGSFEA